MARCYKCHDTGFTKTGERCDCKREIIESGEMDSLDFIPSKYFRVLLNISLINAVTPEYPADLMNLQDNILRALTLKRNHFLYAPPNSSKTVFVYSVLQQLYTYNVKIYPYLDLNELKLVLTMLDGNNKNIPYLRDTFVDPYTLFEVPVLFVKTPIRSDGGTYETLRTILDRRARRGIGTIIVSDIPWQAFTLRDRFKYISSLVGSGEYKTIYLREYARIEV